MLFNVALQVLLPLIFLSCDTFIVLPTLSALCQTHTCSKSNASTAKPMAFALSHTLAPTSGTISPQDIRHSATLSSFKSQLEDISLIRIFQLSHIVLHSYQSVQCVCISSIVFKNPCRYLSFFWITFSISVYIRCVCFTL